MSRVLGVVRAAVGRRPLGLDLVIAASVLAATLLPVLAHGTREWRATALAVLASVPVLWRRRSPVAAGLFVGFGTTGLAFARQLPPLPYGALVCTYTFAVLSPPLWRLAAVCVQAVGIVVSLVVPNEGLVASGYAGMAFVTAYALGTGVRARQVQIEVLKERARRLEDERVAIATTERTRIAWDMHDILTHSVGLMVVQAEAGPLADRAEAEGIFAVIAETGREAIAQLRVILDTLMPSGGPAQRVPVPGISAITALVDRIRQTGLDVRVEQSGRPRAAPADVDLAAYRVIQESLTNVLRHSTASHVRVALAWSQAGLKVSVADDGTPVASAGHAGTAGRGLPGMRERVAGCGGSLRAGPACDGAGFAVTAMFPVEPVA